MWRIPSVQNWARGPHLKLKDQLDRLFSTCGSRFPLKQVIGYSLEKMKNLPLTFIYMEKRQHGAFQNQLNED